MRSCTVSIVSRLPIWGSDGPLACTLGVDAGPIAADDLDPRPVGQPAGEGLGAAIRQEVDHTPAFEIAQDRAVALATTPGPIIDPEDPWGMDEMLSAGSDHAQQRVATHG